MIYAVAKLVSDKIGFSQKNLNNNTNLGWEMRIEELTTSETA